MAISEKMNKEKVNTIKAISSRKINEKTASLAKPANSFLSLHQTIGNKALQRALESRSIQAKLTIGQPNDIYEQEADRVADEVMRMSEHHVQREFSSCSEKEFVKNNPTLSISHLITNDGNITQNVQRYNADVHLHLTKRLALQYFLRRYAEQIANADQSVDEGWTHPYITTPLSFVPGNYSPHFSDRETAEVGVENAIGRRDFVRFGSALHTYQDSFSHSFPSDADYNQRSNVPLQDYGFIEVGMIPLALGLQNDYLNTLSGEGAALRHVILGHYPDHFMENSEQKDRDQRMQDGTNSLFESFATSFEGVGRVSPLAPVRTRAIPIQEEERARERRRTTHGRRHMTRSPTSSTGIFRRKIALEMPKEQTVVATSSLESKINSLKNFGKALSNEARSFFEPRFGSDFSSVRIHEDSNANQLTRSLNAKAFTIGNNIVFSRGVYDLESQSGKWLLGHELTHVVQQGGRPSVQMNSMASKLTSSKNAASSMEDVFTSGKEFPKIASQLSATTISGVWGERRQMGAEDIWVRHDPETCQVEIMGDYADQYLQTYQAELSSGNISVSQLNTTVRADIEATLGPLSEVPSQTLEVPAGEAAVSLPGRGRRSGFPPRAEPAVRPGMPEHLRPGTERFREGLREQWSRGRQQSAVRRRQTERIEQLEEAGFFQPIPARRDVCPRLTPLQALIYADVMEIVANRMMRGSSIDPCRGIRATSEFEAVLEGVVEAGMPGVGEPIGELGPPGSQVSNVLDIIEGGARYNRASLCQTPEGRIRAGIQDAIQMFARENHSDPVRVAQLFREAERVLDRRYECRREQRESRESRR